MKSPMERFMDGEPQRFFSDPGFPSGTDLSYHMTEHEALEHLDHVRGSGREPCWGVDLGRAGLTREEDIVDTAWVGDLTTNTLEALLIAVTAEATKRGIRT